MKKVYAYVAGALIITSSVVISEGCTKSTSSSSSNLIGDWKRADDFEGLARSEAVSFNIGDNGYVCTGASATDRFKDLWMYNTTQRYWTQKANLPGAGRSSAVAFSIGTKAYIGTGYDGANQLSDFWQYDEGTNSWTQKADFAGTARYDAVGFSLNGKGYIGCGFDGNYLKDMWEYDPATDHWTQKASVGGAKRSAAIAFVINGHAYVMSGGNNGTVQQDLWMYDQASNSWTEKNKLFNYSSESFDDNYATIPRQNGVAFIIGAYVYVTTGENSAITPTTWRYDPVADLWLQKTSFEATARTGAVAFNISGRGFVMTGRSGSLIMDDAYEFLPDATKVDGD
jgi:N-acetylneuraminic acid mutarotase